MQNLYLFLEKNAPTRLKQLIPQRWRIWLGYEIKVRRNRSVINIAELQHELILPAGETELSLYNYLSGFHIEGDAPHEEFHMYLRVALRRFFYTLQIIPKGQGKLLEVGAGPYYLSLLLTRFTEYELFFTNFFGSDHPRVHYQTMVNGLNERIKFEYHNVNIEEEPLPFAENTFDVVLLCEVLEHFANDPVRALLNIKRVLKPGGCLILTTPNVNHLENVARMLAGHNIYSLYSYYGPYGRHNREYNREELTQLLKHLGYSIDLIFTSDIHENRAHHFMSPTHFMPLVKPRLRDLGQYIFVRAIHRKPGQQKRPLWLYQSYPPDQLDR